MAVALIPVVAGGIGGLLGGIFGGLGLNNNERQERQMQERRIEHQNMMLERLIQEDRRRHEERERQDERERHEERMMLQERLLQQDRLRQDEKSMLYLILAIAMMICVVILFRNPARPEY